MKALTLTQPWATLVILGVKRIETRGWATPYRGRIAIHAAKGWHRDDIEFAFDTEIERELGDFSPGRFGWLLRDHRPFPRPVPARGALGLREWPA